MCTPTCTAVRRSSALSPLPPASCSPLPIPPSSTPTGKTLPQLAHPSPTLRPEGDKVHAPLSPSLFPRVRLPSSTSLLRVLPYPFPRIPNWELNHLDSLCSCPVAPTLPYPIVALSCCLIPASGSSRHGSILGAHVLLLPSNASKTSLLSQSRFSQTALAALIRTDLPRP